MEVRVTLSDVRAKRSTILRVAAGHRVTNVRVFGSVARGDARPESDVDFLVDLPDDARGFDAFGILDEVRQDLEAVLGREVDVITLRGPFSPKGAEMARQITLEAQAL